VFPVLLHYPELRLTRCAQYETAVENGKATSYLYHFCRKERRGLVQARPGRWAEPYPVRTGSNRLSQHRWAALELLEPWEMRELCRRTQLDCRSVLSAQQCDFGFAL